MVPKVYKHKKRKHHAKRKQRNPLPNQLIRMKIKKNRRRQAMNVFLKERTRTTMRLSIEDEQNESMEDNGEEDEG
jgi:hypothetical protein